MGSDLMQVLVWMGEHWLLTLCLALITMRTAVVLASQFRRLVRPDGWEKLARKLIKEIQEQKNGGED